MAMTIQSITSDESKQFKQLVEDTGDRALKEVGPDKDGLQRLLEKGGKLQAYFVVGIRWFSAKTPNYDLARSILGKDFISPEEIAKSRSVAYSDEQLGRFGDTLPSQEILEWCRDNGFALMATPPKKMSILDVRWFSRDDTTGDGWLMVKKEPVGNSTNKNWDEQKKLIGDAERVPNAAEMCWFVKTFFKVRGVQFFSDICVRTSSRGSDGPRVVVGPLGAVGLGGVLFRAAPRAYAAVAP